MIRIRKTLGVPIIFNENRKFIGWIEDVFLDTSGWKIEGYQIEDKRLFSKIKFVPYSSVIKHGEWLVAVDCEKLKVERNISEDRKAKSFKKEISNMEIVTRNGEQAGVVVDFLFEENGGTIEGAIISKGIIDDCLKGRTILPFLGSVECNEKYIIVEPEALEESLKDEKIK